MPRFNFAEDPDTPKQQRSKPAAEPKPPAARRKDEQPEKIVPPAPERPSPGEHSERSIPFDEAVPKAYRESDTKKYDTKPSVEDSQPDHTPDISSPPEESAPLPTKPEVKEDTVDAQPPKESNPAADIPDESREPQSVTDEVEEDFENPFDTLDHKEYLADPPGESVTEPIDDTEPAAKQSLLPLVGIAAVVLFLIAISVIWFLNPYPPLREALEGLFYAPKTEQPGPQQPETDANEAGLAADTLADAPIQERDWNYYLQISAFKELYKAQDDANRLRKLGLNAKVEGEFIPSQRKTYYRVRLGPFMSAEAAALKGDSLKDVIPSTAFIDSIRVETDVVDSLSNEAPIQQPVLKKPRRRTTASAPVQQPPDIPSNNTPVPSATAGYAVAVGAYKNLQTAQQESRTLIGRGLPAYTSKSIQGGATWYRVLVGPFRTREEADRYLKIVQKESGGSAYIRDLAK